MGLGVMLFRYYHEVPALQAALKAIRPTVIALLVFTIFKLAPSSLLSLDQALIALAMLVLMMVFNMHLALTILLAGLAGILINR